MAAQREFDMKGDGVEGGRLDHPSATVKEVARVAANSNTTENITKQVISRNKEVSSNLSTLSEAEKQQSYEDAKNLFEMKVVDNSPLWLKEFFVKVNTAAKEQGVEENSAPEGQISEEYAEVFARMLLKDEEVISHLPEELQDLIRTESVRKAAESFKIDNASNVVRLAANSNVTEGITTDKARREGLESLYFNSQLGRMLRRVRKELPLHVQLTTIPQQLIADKKAEEARETLRTMQQSKAQVQASVNGNGKFSAATMQKAAAMARKEGIISEMQVDGTYFPAFLSILEKLQKEEDMETGKSQPAPPKSDSVEEGEEVKKKSAWAVAATVSREGFHGVTSIALGSTQIAGDVVHSATGFLVGAAKFLNANTKSGDDLYVLEWFIRLIAFAARLPLTVTEKAFDWLDDKFCSPKQLQEKRRTEKDEKAHRKIEKEMHRQNQAVVEHQQEKDLSEMQQAADPNEGELGNTFHQAPVFQ